MKFLKKSIKLLFVFVLTLSMVLEAPLSAFGSWMKVSAATNLGDILTEVKMQDKNGNAMDPAMPIEITEDTVITLGLDWKIPDGQEVTDGDYAMISIPKVFLPIDMAQAKGDLLFTDPENPEQEVSVGKYSLDAGNNLILAFNDQLRLGGDFEDQRKGNVQIQFKIDVNEFTDSLEKEIAFGDSIHFTIAVKPKNSGAAIAKGGAVDSEANPKYINWTIDVNTKEAALTDAIVSDVIPAGLTLDPLELKIYHLNVGYNGVVQGSEITSVSGGAIQIAEDGKSFQVDFDGINQAYRITYRTKINTYGITYSNVASIKDGAAGVPETAVKVLGPYIKASALEKREGVPQNDSKGNTRSIKWILDINKMESDIGNAIIEDQVDQNQSIIPDSVKIFKLVKNGTNWSQGSQVVLEPDKIEINSVTGSSLKVTLGALSKEAYQITYETGVQYPEEFVPQLICNNTAVLKDDTVMLDTVSSTAKAVRVSLLKKQRLATTINYTTKKISWELTVNGGEHPIGGAVIHDSLPEGLTLDKDSIVIKNAAGTTIYSKSVPNANISVLPGGSIVGPAEFSIGLGDITKQFTISYDTVIAPEKYAIDILFENQAWITANDNSITPNSGEGTENDKVKATDKPRIENTFTKGTLGSSVTVGGIAYGPVNYVDKTMSWTFTIKPTKEDITKLMITDTFPQKGLYFQENSLRFKRGSTVLNWTKDIDYTITPATVEGEQGYQKGFVLTINQTMSGSDYTVYYKPVLTGTSTPA